MPPQRMVLVVEDNEINRTMLCDILAPEYRTLEAANGREALEVLREYGERVALILLDIVMPVMDGYAFLAAAKADPAYASIPVIVTTQSDGEEDEVRALAAGAADFVSKPYRPQIILHRAASIIHLRETAAMINQFKYDRLTGLYSKEYFMQRARELLRDTETEFDLFCSNIENFKLVNDVFGVPAGDRLLQRLAQYCRDALAHSTGICGRLTADRFAVLLPHSERYNEEFFRQRHAEIDEIAGIKNLSVKWGVLTVGDRKLSVEGLCDRAILAATSIKGQYGRYSATYDDELRAKLLRERAIAGSMESALAEGQFELYLQPEYSARDGRLVGAEALVRWNHPEWGLQLPDEFIPLFERNGFITRMDQYVWERACAILRDWDDRGLPPVFLSVNVSRADIYNTDLPRLLSGLVARHGLSPSRLHLELTESAYTEDPQQIVEAAEQLRRHGFLIEMDDFGKGYSSLNMLNHLPIDVLKLDMGFIRSETAKPASQGILRFIISLARWMDLHVLAEGVETAEQFDRLQELGCDYVQGYYFARPMPQADFERLLLEQANGAAPDRARVEAADRAQVFLVADEDAAYRDRVRQRFSGRFHVREAATVQEALAVVSQLADRLAVILLSMSLPGLESPDQQGALRQEKLIWSVPLIATGAPSTEAEALALALGADDFAGKPHLLEGLWRRVSRVLDLAAAHDRARVLQDEACRDHLTGLLNRRGLEAAMRALHRNDSPLAVCLFDLDGLRLVNDSRGHAEGDRALTRFASLLRARTRESDILARVGGDEFFVILRRMWSEDTALRKGTEICGAFRESCAAEGLPLACSAGVLLWDAETPVDDVLRWADAALAEAKAEGKGGCRLWRLS